MLGPLFGGLEFGLLTLVETSGGGLDAQLFDRRQELVQRWVEQTNRYWQTIHGQQNLFEVDLLHTAEVGQCGEFLFGSVGENHLANHWQTVGRQEHVLGAAQADALSAEVARVGGVFASVGVGANAKLALANHIGPLEDGVELGWWLGGRQLHCANNHFAGGAVEADDIAFFDNNSADGELLTVDLDGVGAHDCGRTPTACHNGSVTHQTTASGEDALADHHAVHVFGAGFAANKDDLFATLVGLHCVVGGEVDPAHSSTWRRSETLG
ncbi:unannotated protein [freshwater metagenome]|uniref:Unannotated protein n=1 Tax=freshwater metagenome TaxID=449393 RepID=A0A6J6YIM9_9ZZZZ